MKTTPTPTPLAGSGLPAAPGSAIPRRPWLLSKQYTMTFVLSKDNEIIVDDTACKYLGDDVLRHIIAAVNEAAMPPSNSEQQGGRVPRHCSDCGSLRFVWWVDDLRKYSSPADATDYHPRLHPGAVCYLCNRKWPNAPGERLPAKNV